VATLADVAILPSGLRPIQLYHRADVFDDDRNRCVALGWAEASLDCGGWHQPEVMHDDLARHLGLPSYYGRNLDALSDLMAEVATGGAGFAAAAPGGLITLDRFDTFHAAATTTAQALLDILYQSSIEALMEGRALVSLVRSDDRSLKPAPVGQVAIQWNRAERGRHG
jgi:hypothetical protein